uniref:Uncharacterized protein n=2 Tax=Helianthus annuus TaxID=4232 RepID=A0A251V537_HELAN
MLRPLHPLRFIKLLVKKLRWLWMIVYIKVKWYIIRRDLDDFHLKNGTSVAFGIVKGILLEEIWMMFISRMELLQLLAMLKGLLHWMGSHIWMLSKNVAKRTMLSRRRIRWRWGLDWV